MQDQQIVVTGWYMEYRDPTNNHHKFYTVLVAENGVLVTNWGRIGATGQSSIKKLPSQEDAYVLGQRQVFAKRAKGYVAVHEDVKFTLAESVTVEAAELNVAYYMTRPFFAAAAEPQYEGDKKAVSAHYDEFVERAQKLMSEASTRPFDAVYAEFEELQEAWQAISDKHDEAKVTIDLTTQLLNQRLMSGSL